MQHLCQNPKFIYFIIITLLCIYIFFAQRTLKQFHMGKKVTMRVPNPKVMKQHSKASRKNIIRFSACIEVRSVSTRKRLPVTLTDSIWPPVRGRYVQSTVRLSVMGELDLNEHCSDTCSPRKACTLGLALISRERALQTPDETSTKDKDYIPVICEGQEWWCPKGIKAKACAAQPQSKDWSTVVTTSPIMKNKEKQKTSLTYSLWDWTSPS